MKTDVGWIRRGGWRAGRVRRFAGAAREVFITPNGDGGGVLCDESGEIRFIVDRDVVRECEGGGIGMRDGRILTLRDAPVLTAGSGAHALVITKASLVSVLTNDDDVDDVGVKESARAKREALRDRLRASAAEAAAFDVDWEDAEADEAEDNEGEDEEENARRGYGGDREIECEDEAGRRGKGSEATASAFAMSVAAMFHDE